MSSPSNSAKSPDLLVVGHHGDNILLVDFKVIGYITLAGVAEQPADKFTGITQTSDTLVILTKAGGRKDDQVLLLCKCIETFNI